MTHEGNGRRRALEAVNGKLGSIKSREEINEHRFGELKDERTDRKTSINQVMKQYKNYIEDLESSQGENLKFIRKQTQTK